MDSHFITVSGLIINKLLFQLIKKLFTIMKNILSDFLILGLVQERFNISICFLRYKFSNCSWVLDFKEERRKENNDLSIGVHCLFNELLEM